MTVGGSKLKSIAISELAEALGAKYAGDGALVVSQAVHPHDATVKDSIVIAMDAEFVAMIDVGMVGTAVLATGTNWKELGLKAAIFVERPRHSMSKVTMCFARHEGPSPGIHPTAQVSKSASLGENPSIGPFVLIEDGAVIGNNAHIMSHTSIGREAKIGSDALLHSGVRIGHNVTMGDRVIIHQNAVVGADGFSFVTPERGAVEVAKESKSAEVIIRNTAYSRIYSLGAVTLGDDVEVGAGTTLDRGTLQNTIIGAGTKIDNLVQVAHNVTVGSGCLLCAQVGLAGSATIGDRVVIGGKAGVADHVKVGSDVLIAAASAVAGNVASNNIVMGVPAVKRDEAMGSLMAIRRLPRLFRTVEMLKAQLSENTD